MKIKTEIELNNISAEDMAEEIFSRNDEEIAFFLSELFTNKGYDFEGIARQIINYCDFDELFDNVECLYESLKEWKDKF